MDYIVHTTLPHFVTTIRVLGHDMASISLSELCISLYIKKNHIKLLKKIPKFVKKNNNLHQSMDTISNYFAKQGTPNILFWIGSYLGIPRTAPDYVNAYIVHFET